MKKLCANSKIIIKIILRIDKKTIWYKIVNQLFLSEYKIARTKMKFQIAIEFRENLKLIWKIIIIVVKIKIDREFYQFFFIENFIKTKWNTIITYLKNETIKRTQSKWIVQILIQNETNSFFIVKQQKKLKFEKFVVKKRLHETFSFDFIELNTFNSKRNTRTNKLKNDKTKKHVDDDIIRRQKKLVNRWRCIDERCINEQKKNDISLIETMCIISWIILKCLNELNE